MAKRYVGPKHVVGRVVTTKTAFGSHKEMIVPCDDPIVQNIKLEANQVVCKDDIGPYITTIDRIDSGLADPNRYGDSTRRAYFSSIDTEQPIQ